MTREEDIKEVVERIIMEQDDKKMPPGHPSTWDDNPDIIDLIKERMEIGAPDYGHGLRAMDDTREWGTKMDSWCEMGLEEALDTVIYLCISLIRLRRELAALRAKGGNTTPQGKQSPTEPHSERTEGVED